MKSKEIMIEFVSLIILAEMMLQSFQTIGNNHVADNMRVPTVSSAATIVGPYQNLTYEGDLFIGNNQTFVIEKSEFHMKGKITVNDTSTLFIVNSKFFTSPGLDGESIVLNDYATLVMSNITVIFNRPYDFDCAIILHDSAEANITYSTFQNLGVVIGYNHAVINMLNSTMGLGKAKLRSSGLATFDGSYATIEKSTVDGVFVWGASSAFLNNSAVGLVRTGWDQADKTQVNVENSKVEQIEVFGGTPAIHVEDSNMSYARFGYNSSVWFEKSSVEDLSAQGNSTVWLIDSSSGTIETGDHAAVLVGWHLPLFGLVTIPYSWISVIQTAAWIAVIVMVVIVLLVWHRRRARRMKEKFLERVRASEAM